MSITRKLISPNYSFFDGHLVGSFQREILQVLENHKDVWLSIREIVNCLCNEWCNSESFTSKTINALHAMARRGIVAEIRLPITIKFRDGTIKHESRLAYHWKL